MRMMKLRPFLHYRQMVYIKTRRGNHLVYLFKRGLSTKKLFVLFFQTGPLNTKSKTKITKEKVLYNFL